MDKCRADVRLVTGFRCPECGSGDVHERFWVKLNRSYTPGQPPKAEDFDFDVNDYMYGEEGGFYCAACEQLLDAVDEPQ